MGVIDSRPHSIIGDEPYQGVSCHVLVVQRGRIRAALDPVVPALEIPWVGRLFLTSVVISLIIVILKVVFESG